MGKLAALFSKLKKAAPAAKSVGSALGTAARAVKAAPIIGKTAGAAGAVKTVAQGAVLGAGLKVGEESVGALKDPGFILFIAGLLTFIFNEYLNNVALAVFLGTIFLFYSSFYIFKKKGLVLTLVFWIWYIFFGGITDPNSFLYALGPLLIAGMLIHGLLTRFSKKGTFLEGATGELIGLVPILFFFLDLGLLSFLTKTFNLPLSPLLQNLILFTPWWALLGLFTTEKDNFFIKIARLVGIIYIFSIISFGVVPEAYFAYQSALPGPGEFLKAKEEVLQQVPKKENPALSNLACIFSQPTNVQACVQQRQAESELKSICQQKNLPEDAEEFKACLKEEKEKKEKAGLQAAGTTDPTIKQPTKVQFETSEYFPKTTYRPFNYEPSTLSYPIQLKIENPRAPEQGNCQAGQCLTLKISCLFQKSSQENITGLISPQELFVIDKRDETKSFICTPQEPLNGSYTLTYTANIYGLKTTSRLTRAFIGQKTEDQKKLLLPELKSTYFSGSKYLSQAPQEFARLNFGFGEPENNPFIEADDNPILVSTIENTAPGRLLRINNYLINLPGFSLSQGEPYCLQKDPAQEISLPRSTTSSYRQNIPLPSCFLTLPPDLQTPSEEFVIKEFEAALEYDYQLEEKIPIQVQLIET